MATGAPDLTTLQSMSALTISPADQILTFTDTQTPMPVPFAAAFEGNPVQVKWSLDRSDIGSIDPQSGLFTPKGTLGAKAHVTATYADQTGSTTVTVRLESTQNGDPTFGTTTTPGAGGYNGVGGNGPGGPASSTQLQTLSATPALDSNVSMLYPYDQMLWPRGIFAPLLQWNSSTHHFDSIRLHIHENNYDYVGTFNAPTGAAFANLPIPQKEWDLLTASNEGDEVQVEIVFGEGANAVGPYTQTWKVSHAALKGTIYYQAYGSTIATSGAGVLSIKPGEKSPTLVSTTPGGCMGCHTVSPDGKATYVQDGGNVSHRYDLLNGNAQTTMTATRLAYPAISPDGTVALSSSGGASNGTNDIADESDSLSKLYSWPGATLLASSGLPSGLRATMPVFSPDGKHIAFVYWAGPSGDQKSLAMIDFEQSSSTFSNLQVLTTPTVGQTAWPVFLPNGNGIVYEVQLNAATAVSDPEYGFTRDGIRAELWYYDLVHKGAVRLDNLNGKSYLPTGTSGHADDPTLNYEPTVSPIASGGYGWVVFTSRRLYGNVATIDPFQSDPRSYNLTANITTKKLWVAPIDLNAAAGQDPSFPAFYLPAQELYGTNSRGFWAIDPCHSDGTSCDSGDECCGGCCEPDASGAMACSAPIVDSGYCSSVDNCSALYEKCTQDADCCGAAAGGVTCVNLRCVEGIIN